MSDIQTGLGSTELLIVIIISSLLIYVFIYVLIDQPLLPSIAVECLLLLLLSWEIAGSNLNPSVILEGFLSLPR
jgi:hypothetical protein